MINKINLAILTMCNVGRIKYAPGSFASLITCILFYFFYKNIFGNLIFVFTILIILFLLSISIIDKYLKFFKKKDPKEIVIDEFFGQLIPLFTIFFLNSYEPFLHWNLIYNAFLAFFLFRLFDVSKPFPCNIIDKNMKNGLGIVLDDIIAGIYASIIILCIWKI